ncbi:MAG: homoserine dehydrogenase [Actinomycetota bacterium]|nr:homoserine dehydrogenase [Actinomycetota bacterium]
MKVGVGILGGGIVGGALAHRLLTGREEIAARTGLDLELRHLAVRDLSKPRRFTFPEGTLTDDASAVIQDPSVDLVVELLGGLDPAGDLVLQALEAGKPVVTANKELVATRGLDLIQKAEEKGVSLLFEAAVGGAIPIIRPLSESLAGENITDVLGIVNGTTNYILTQMCETDASYADALAEAQERGYAEADPTADVSGADAAAKAAILASLAFGTWVGSDQVYREGIEDLNSTDIAFAADLGYLPKLLAVATDDGNGVAVRVHPMLVPLGHPLANISGSQNAVYVKGPDVDELLFAGPGAGGDPTATAVLGDIIEAARELLAGSQVPPRVRFAPGRIVDFAEVDTSWYLRLEVADEPGVLAQIAQTIGDNHVSIESMVQLGRGETATLLFITHPSKEANHRTALAALKSLDVVRQVPAAIRVLPE